MPYNPNAPWDQSAEALAQAYQAASNGMGTGYNITGAELNTYGSDASGASGRDRDRAGPRGQLGLSVPAWATWKAPPRSTTRPAPASTRPAIRRRRQQPTAASTCRSRPAAPGGEIVVTGGTDLSTGLPNQLVLTAPLGATQVNPFTTLLDDVMRVDPSLTESSAITRIDQSLGLPSTFDFTQEDYLDGALGGNSFDAAAFALDAKIAATANMAVGMLGGLTGAPGAVPRQATSSAAWPRQSTRS